MMLDTLNAKFTNLEVPLLWHHGQNDGLHGGDVAEPHLGNVEGAYHVGPVAVVGALQCPLATRAKLASLGKLISREQRGGEKGNCRVTYHSGSPLLRFAFSAVPRPGWNR